MLTNAPGGVIASHWMGVQIGNSTTSDVSGTVVNYGVILAEDSVGDGAGVWIHGPGVITNEKGGGSAAAATVSSPITRSPGNQGTVFGRRRHSMRPAPAMPIASSTSPAAHFPVSSTAATRWVPRSTARSNWPAGPRRHIVNIGTFVDFGRIALDAGPPGRSAARSSPAKRSASAGRTPRSSSPAHPPPPPRSPASPPPIRSSSNASITDVSGLHFGAGNLLTVSESTAPGLTLQFDAQPDLQYAVVDGSTDIYVPCFLPGTFILTDQGEVPVEKLQLGDRIATFSGTTRRLSWIGRGRTLATRGRRNAATPVIVRRARSPTTCRTTTCTSPRATSLFLDGVLIPVEFLVNHRSILWDDRAQEVTVYHLELDTHDVLIANGAPAESYRDDGNRWLFQNANDGWDSRPNRPVRRC